MPLIMSTVFPALNPNDGPYATPPARSSCGQGVNALNRLLHYLAHNLIFRLTASRGLTQTIPASAPLNHWPVVLSQELYIPLLRGG
jgi:hypothetical protein